MRERRHLRATPAHLLANVSRRRAGRRQVRVRQGGHGHVLCAESGHAYRSAWVKLYHDRVASAVGAEVVAEHRRAFCRCCRSSSGSTRALAEATALLDWRLVPVWARAELARHTRKPDQEWVRMLPADGHAPSRSRGVRGDRRPPSGMPPAARG